MLSGPCEILPWGPMNPQIFKNLYLFPWKDLQNVFWSKSLSMGSLKIHMERALDPCKYLPRALLFLAATKQLCKWYFPSVRLSVTPFYTPVFRRDVLWYCAVRPSVRPSVRPTVSTKKHRCKWQIFFKFCTQVCLGVPSINLLFVLSYLIKYAHNSIISDFSIFGIHRVIF